LTDLVVNPPERRADVVEMDAANTSEAAPATEQKDTNTPMVESSAGIVSILSATDPVVPIKQTSKGKPNVPAQAGDFGGDGTAEQAANAIDGNTDSKYFNKGQDADGSPAGVHTGLVVTPAAGAKAVNEFQFATANDMPDRDPVRITVEGSNAPDAAETQGNGFVLLYEGPSGLENDPGRNQWGQAVHFKNEKAYRSYRVLVTATRGDADATQYSEIKLGAAAPEGK
jgi:hypothetical protein